MVRITGSFHVLYVVGLVQSVAVSTKDSGTPLVWPRSIRCSFIAAYI